MNGDLVNSLTNQALWLVVTASMPVVLTAALTGLIISVLQALTQVQDQGLPTAFKFFAVMLAIFLTYLGTANEFLGFGNLIFEAMSKV